MEVKLPRGLRIDLDNIPENFDAQIRQCFAEYTEGTADAYTFEDKLCFIDVCVELLHREKDSEEEVLDLMKGYMEYMVREQGEVPSEEDYLSLEFMQDCYSEGKKMNQLYSRYVDDMKDNERIEKLLLRIMKVILFWPEEPAAQKPEWIPAEKAPPEEGEDVLVKFDDGYKATVSFIDGEFELWADAGEPVCWMRLPE